MCLLAPLLLKGTKKVRVGFYNAVENEDNKEQEIIMFHTESYQSKTSSSAIYHL